MKSSFNMRLVSLALLVFFINSVVNVSASCQPRRGASIAKGSSLVNQAPSSFPCEEKEDSDSLGESEEEVDFVGASALPHRPIKINLLLARTENHLSHVTYCIGNPLYLAHRILLI